MLYPQIRGNFEVDTAPERLDVDAAHAYLSRSYWAEGIPRETVARALAGSLCFGLYDGGEGGNRGGGSGRQIGLARVITDRATFGYLCDVYVLEEYRGRGLGHWLMECVLAHPDLQGLRRFMLITRDAQELYRPFGFAEITYPERHMAIVRPGLYRQG